MGRVIFWYFVMLRNYSSSLDLDGLPTWFGIFSDSKGRMSSVASLLRWERRRPMVVTIGSTTVFEETAEKNPRPSNIIKPSKISINLDKSHPIAIRVSQVVDQTSGTCQVVEEVFPMERQGTVARRAGKRRCCSGPWPRKNDGDIIRIWWLHAITPLVIKHG